MVRRGRHPAGGLRVSMGPTDRGVRGAPSRSHVVAGLFLTAAIVFTASIVYPSSASAAAIVTPAGYDTNAVLRGDDSSNLVVGLPFAMNWAGTSYTRAYLNMNGNVTFDNTFTSYDPQPALSTLNHAIMAPFWADVDTRNTATSQMTYSDITTGSVPTIGGRKAFLVNWINVSRYNSQATPLNSFQLVLIDRSDTGVGNFDFEFNYDTINWDFPTASSNGYARAGWARTDGTALELPGGNTSGRLLDTGANALIDGSLNSGGVLGRYVWQVRNGTPVNSPPLINLTFSTKTLQANTGPATPGYTGYSGAADATAVDLDGTIVSFTRNPVAGTFLPLGSNTVTWTATDNSGAVAVATQEIDVVDPAPPSLPALSSPTHSLSTWYALGTIGINWTNSVDPNTGVDGYSYSWTANAAGLPDTTEDSFTPGTPINPTLESESFPTNTWPVDWLRPAGDSQTYLRANNVAGRNHGTSAAEVWSNGNTRRTVQFSKTFDLSTYSDATLSFWDYSVQLEAPDYNTVEYSTDGTNWTNLQTRATNVAWTARTYDIPTGSSTVTIRFSGSVNANNEFVCWDDILLTAVGTTPNAISNDPGDGRWYFNIRAVDGAGNWTPTAASLGPFWIDRTPPITTGVAPVVWVPASTTVGLSATDAVSGVKATRYKLDASAVATYTVPITVSGSGMHTLLFWSLDNAGNVETTKTATIGIDGVPPSAPTSVTASGVSTSSIVVGWDPATDALSGVSYYRVYQDGSLVATTTALGYTATGLVTGQAYSYTVVAVDRAGNAGPAGGPAVASTALLLTLDISAPGVAFGGLSPGVPVTLPGIETVSVRGIGLSTYDFSCAAADFSNVDTASPSASMPVGVLSFATSGYRTLPVRTFTAASLLIDTASGAAGSWQHDYVFDYSMTVPWSSEPSTYTTSIQYTVVSK
jgi:hypothetical protein